MNKLEEYKKSLMQDYGILHDPIDDAKNEGINVGFDAAIELDLPVKFATWCGNIPNNDREAMLLHFGYLPSNKEMYKYWIENIYKP